MTFFIRSLSILSVALLATASPSGAFAQQAQPPAQPAPRPSPTPQVLAFDAFMKQSSPVCQHQSSKRCVDAGWRFADRDGDGTLTLEELQSVRAGIGDWLAWKEGISARDKANLAMGIWVVDSAGLPNLFNSYDADHDGRLTRKELLADVKLDDRPLGKVLTDEKAVNRKQFSQRLGPLSKLAEALMQPRPSPGATPAPRPPVQSQTLPGN